MFTYNTQIKLHHTDAAGILFFANQFTIIHDAYEEILEEIGSSFQEMLTQKDFFLPIVHAASDYKAPLFVGDRIEVSIKIGHIGDTSFSFEYEIKRDDGTLVGTAKTVHVTTDKKTREKIPIPDEMRKHLENYS